MIGCTVGSRDLVESASDYPYFYTMLNQAHDQGAGLVELLQDLGVGTVAVIHHDDLFGIEFKEVAQPALEDAGIEIAYQATYPVNRQARRM